MYTPQLVIAIVMHSTVWFILLLLIDHDVTISEYTEEISAVYELMSDINTDIMLNSVRYVSENGNDTGNCTDSEKPCKTLRFASLLDGSSSNIMSLKIKVDPGEYDLNNNGVYFYESHNIVLEGAGVENTIIRCGNTTPPNDTTCIFENFAFYNSSNIWIRNVTFDGCGPYPSAHFIYNCSNVILENNVYQYSSAPAVIAYLTSPVYIINSDFNDNIVTSVSNEKCLTSSNGLFFRDNVTSTGGISVYNENQTQDIIILNCHFDNNFARNNTEIDFIPNQLKRFGRGGGLSVRLVNSDDGFIYVVNSSFNKNTAEVGGGAVSLTIAESDGNNVTFSNVTFNENSCLIDKCTGGAVKADLFAPAKQNRVNFLMCNFSNNSAASGSGGAISIASSDKGFNEAGTDAYKIVTMDSCNFKGNIAKFEGTAVGFFSLGRVNQAGFRILMKDW